MKESRLASQAAWHRMENGPKRENEKNCPKNRKWPTARNGEKMAQNGEKMGFGVIFLFFHHFGAISHFRISARYQAA